MTITAQWYDKGISHKIVWRGSPSKDRYQTDAHYWWHQDTIARDSSDE